MELRDLLRFCVYFALFGASTFLISELADVELTGVAWNRVVSLSGICTLLHALRETPDGR